MVRYPEHAEGRILASVSAGAVEGLDGYIASVKVDIYPGLPSFSIVGLPDRRVR